MSRMKSPNSLCNMNSIKLFVATIFFSLLLSSGSALAGTWKPLCPVGSRCNAPYQFPLGGGAGGYHPVDPDAAGPLLTSQGILLLHTPVYYPEPCDYCVIDRHIFRWSSQGLTDLGGDLRGISDINTLQLADGKILAFGLYGLAAWYESGDGIETLNWNGLSVISLNNAAIILPPVATGDAIYIGLRGGGASSIYASFDQGDSWTVKGANIRIGDDRYNLLTNPEQDGLWAISSEFFELPGSLWESADHGANWTRVDNGSFPANTVRVVHHPVDRWASYALTDHGLFISFNRGVSWEPTALTEAVHGLAFVDQDGPNSPAMVVGTDGGIKLSVDEGVSWSDMSNGLFEGPHTITYADGQLLATGANGYFTCNALDCGGLAQGIPPEESLGLVEVIEFYNTSLDHYFITSGAGEAVMIDQGGAGPGWERTGESFKAWNLWSNPDAANMCRFYGSVQPGPNSHFYSDTALECRMLQALQEDTPAGEKGWNFEGWAMSVIPRGAGEQQPCPDNSTAVYRAYNNGFALGKDSNHRYATNSALLDAMQEDGWINEGIAFCSPNG
ncbi:MAG: hypothetical protein SH820_08275 [Xanthomonadales bacterium]|nr:hypothetical protein [Xanthomonadales bacterium]